MLLRKIKLYIVNPLSIIDANLETKPYFHALSHLNVSFFLCGTLWNLCASLWNNQSTQGQHIPKVPQRKTLTELFYKQH